jgi:hypothetical protein
MMLLRFLFLCSLGLALPAQAEMYKYVDEQGRVTYSNKPIKGGKKVELPELSTMPAPKLPPAAAKPETAKPESGKSEPATRDDRRKELQAQIAKEEQALAEAKQAYKEGADKPEVWQHKTPDGKVVRGRNVPAYEEKMKRLQADVDAHQNALDKLKAELAALDAPPAKPEEKK